MMRLTRIRRILRFAQGPMFNDTKWDRERFEKALYARKSAHKRALYNGTYLKCRFDKQLWYHAIGGPRKGRLNMRKASTPRQFCHPARYHDKVALRWEPTGTELGGCSFQTWDGQMQVNDINSPHTSRYMSAMDRQTAIVAMESYGTKIRIIDEYVKPRITNFFYSPHQLYSKNFKYIKDPVTNYTYGDADYFWKGGETIDYTTPPPKDARVRPNIFYSMWAAQFRKPKV